MLDRKRIDELISMEIENNNFNMVELYANDIIKENYNDFNGWAFKGLGILCNIDSDRSTEGFNCYKKALSLIKNDEGKDIILNQMHQAVITRHMFIIDKECNTYENYYTIEKYEEISRIFSINDYYKLMELGLDNPLEELLDPVAKYFVNRVSNCLINVYNKIYNYYNDYNKYPKKGDLDHYLEHVWLVKDSFDRMYKLLKDCKSAYSPLINYLNEYLKILKYNINVYSGTERWSEFQSRYIVIKEYELSQAEKNIISNKINQVNSSIIYLKNNKLISDNIDILNEFDEYIKEYISNPEVITLDNYKVILDESLRILNKSNNADFVSAVKIKRDTFFGIFNRLHNQEKENSKKYFTAKQKELIKKLKIELSKVEDVSGYDMIQNFIKCLPSDGMLTSKENLIRYLEELLDDEIYKFSILKAEADLEFRKKFVKEQMENPTFSSIEEIKEKIEGKVK